jgi:Ring finger domain
LSPPTFLKIDFFFFIFNLFNWSPLFIIYMPAITRSSSNRQQNNPNNPNNPIIIENQNENNPALVAALPLTTPNVPTVPVLPLAPKAPLKTLSHDLDLNSNLGYCCICCDDIVCENGRFVLDCGHTFHGNCILRSFKHDSRCPMCRAQVDAAEKNSGYLLPTALRINSSIISVAADHFIEDMGSITVANVIHRMLLMSSDNPDMRSIQIPYIKRILVQFATMFITGIAFSIRDGGEQDVQEPVPIDVVNNEDPLRREDEYDAAISNPAIDAAVSYQSIVSSDINFDASQPDNVGAILLRRAIALSELGSQRAELASRRAARADARHQQMQLVQQHLRTEMLRRQAVAEQLEQQNTDADGQENSDDDETVVMEEQEGEQEQQQEQEENPWGPQF